MAPSLPTSQVGKLANVKPEDVLERYLSEELTEDIAKSLGVTFAGLSHWLITHAEQQWKSSQLILAIKRKHDADKLMASATNALELARAREQLKSAQWDLERVCRRIYGQDQPQNLTVPIQINIGISRDETLQLPVDKQ